MRNSDPHRVRSLLGDDSLSVASDSRLNCTPGNSESPRTLTRKLVVAGMLAVTVLILSLSFNQTGNAANKDFVSYWAAGQRLVHHRNPYDKGKVLHLEKSVGFRPTQPLLMRNPPYGLFLALPLGVLGLNIAAVFWSLLLVGSILISIRILWRLYGSPAGSLHLMGYLFAPVLACMTLGQTSVFLLLGIALFLRLHNSYPVLAGISLSLLAIKPHLLLPFAIVLLLWVIARKNYRVILGLSMVMIVLSLLPLAFHPTIWTDYGPVFAEADQESQLIPTFSALFQILLGCGVGWTQLIPAALGCLWAVWYFWRNRSSWNWKEHGSLLLLVSALVAPYSWFTDEIVVLPAILGQILSSDKLNRPFILFSVLNGLALFATLLGVPIGSGFYIWTPTAWLAWYLYATRRSHNTDNMAFCANTRSQR